MLTRIVVGVGVVVLMAACGPQSPEQEAADFLQAVADCLSDNRQQVASSVGDGAMSPDRWESLCGMHRDDLSPAAQDLVQESGSIAFREIAPGLMRAAFAGAGSEAMGEELVTLLVDAFTSAAEQTRAGQETGS